ncbi:BolA-like protein [Colletotrichum truncatum]|uniref:BolA-like protein n=1 Tax=Colletotrichum truncatum TaxID=5467 RepID=A0ACC3YKA7_COLTU|nr:BolA-like protein [Colletotrichum truncatum]KAF6784407.1 BolA-like protein [Colletotrichum truncatum]
MLCRSCRRAIALTKAAPSNFAARAAAASSPIASRSYSSSPCVRANTPSTLAYQSSYRLSTQISSKRTYSSAAAESSSTALEKPDHLDDAESTIWDKLVAEFSPSELIVQDVSGGCGSMYAIDITSTKFKGANMLKQQRMVNAVLGDMMKQWHGVQLRTKAP